ncbi:MAG: hypothetical protein VB137_02365 [Burkholderia sp.]
MLSLRYLTFTPIFSRHFYTSASEETEDEGPTGGFMRDGAAGVSARPGGHALAESERNGEP